MKPLRPGKEPCAAGATASSNVALTATEGQKRVTFGHKPRTPLELRCRASTAHAASAPRTSPRPSRVPAGVCALRSGGFGRVTGRLQGRDRAHLSGVIWVVESGGPRIRDAGMTTRGQGKRRSLGWLALAAGLALAIGVGDARGAFPGANGRVAFAVEKWRLPDPCLPMPHGCDPEAFSSSIETVLPSGRGRRVLRSFPVEQGVGESGPVWSPSGRLLTLQQSSRLAVIRADGTGDRQSVV